jgi:predicted NAD-dependent protein-ADP-ribosyltransferase YbiA (DUF1768 family)
MIEIYYKQNNVYVYYIHFFTRNMNSLYATLKTKYIPLKYDDVHNIIPLDEDAPESKLKPLDEIMVDYQKMDSAKNMDRNSILEQLRKKRVLITICETEEDKSKIQSSIVEEKGEEQKDALQEEAKEEDIQPRVEKETVTLDDDDEDEKEESTDRDEDNVDTPFTRNDIEETEKAQEKEVPFEKIDMPKENMNPAGLSLPAPTTTTVFVICSSTKNAPGKASKEQLNKKNPDEDYKELSKQGDWRHKLCNAYESPLDIDGYKWTNVDHYLIYMKYKYYEDEELLEGLKDYKKAKELDKKGTFKVKNDKGKLVKTNIPVDDTYEENKFKYTYHALYTKFTTSPELLKILYLTYPAKLMVRHGKDKVEDFDELMVLREQLYLYLQGEYGTPTQIDGVGIREREKKGKPTQATYIAENFQLSQMPTRLPKREKIFMKQNAYYMHNRAKFHLQLKKLFEKHEQARRNGDKYDDSSDLLMHQRVVLDYLNVYTPYRGLLIYHGLGSGKTYTSVAIAEGMKSSKRIVVMLPASLHYNYVTELEKFGDPLYRVDQYWEFVPTEGKDELIQVFADALSLSVEYVREKGGAYMVDVSKPSNYESLTTLEQENIRKQIVQMIEQKYSFLHYNAGQSFINKMTEMSTKTKQENPFDHSVVVIDEAHNLISNIKNNLEKKDSPTNNLYNLLMTAQDVRIVLLSGTPIVNHPFEMAIIYNILRGKINTWELDVETTSAKKLDSVTIEKILDESHLNYYDLIDYKSSTKKLTITKNPFGFYNKNSDRKKNKTQKGGYHVKSLRKTKRNIPSSSDGMEGGTIENYKGVTLNEKDILTEKEFIVQVKKRLSENGIDIKNKMLRPKGYVSLPNKEKDFQEKFVKQYDDGKGTGDILNRDTLHRRIMGLTSYFRSPKEGLLPDFVLTENGQEYHNIMVEMSDTQFEAYATLRTEERDRETKQKKKERMARARGGQNNHEVLQSTGSYRSSTRLVCNYAIPSDPGRPRILEIDVQEKVGEEDNPDIDTDKEARREKKKIYDKEIERVANLMREKKDQFFSDDALTKYSPKFFEMIQRINDKEHKGPHLIYSDFLNMEGIEFFKMVLEHNNMRELQIEKYGKDGWRLKDFDNPEHAGKLCYITYTGEGEGEERDLLRNIYNSDWTFVPDEISDRLQQIAETNKYGGIVKVIMITRAGAEGINLKNTRYVHIMEPYWHKTRIDQVVGRARRIGSHMDLEPELRTVQVFQYLSVFSESQKKNDQYKEIMINDISKLDGKTPVTTDLYLYELSLLKQRLNDQFLRVIKESAVDCRLYRSSHSKKEPLVCYGDSKDNSNEFTSHPYLQVDLENQPVNE